MTSLRSCSKWLAALVTAASVSGVCAQTAFNVNADGWSSVWVQRGSGVLWDAVWTKGNQQVVTVMQGRIRGSEIDMRRVESSDGALCEYRGTLSPDRRSASGAQICPGRSNGTWQASLVAVSSGPPVSVGPVGGGQVLSVNADDWSSLWQQRGSSQLWDAVWTNGGQQVVTVMQGSVQGGQVLMRRISSSDGVMCEYRGDVQADRRSVFGTQSCPGRAEAAWRGQFEGMAGAGGGVYAPPQPQQMLGTRFVFENFAFGEPDRPGDRSNDREFMVDFARCTVRELNRETEQGRQQTQVSVCQPERRLAFATVLNGRVTGEYDWTFREGGRTAAGAWRSANGAGLSVGREVTPNRPGFNR